VYFAIFIWGDIACNGCWLYFGSMFLVLIAYIYLSQFEVFKYWFINTQLPCIHKKLKFLYGCPYCVGDQLYGASRFYCYSCDMFLCLLN
jgi:hypothetical protein